MLPDPNPSGPPPISIIICKFSLYQTLALLETIHQKGQTIRKYCDKLNAVENRNTSNKKNTRFVQKIPFSQNRTQKRENQHRNYTERGALNTGPA